MLGEGELACEGPVAAVGAGADPSSISGAANAPSLEESFALFRNAEARAYAWLPLDGYALIRRDSSSALFGHEAGRRVRAVALFSNLDDTGRRTDWFLVQVAACDPVEFAPDVPISQGLRIWSLDGVRQPTSRLLDHLPPCGAAELIRLDGAIFLRAPSPAGGALLGEYEDRASLPATAVATGWTEDARRLWTMPDGTAILVGTDDRLERWPRLVDDDLSAIDCG